MNNPEVRQAKQVTHPLDAHDCVDDDIKMATAHTSELQHDENFLHKNMLPEIASIAHSLEL